MLSSLEMPGTVPSSLCHLILPLILESKYNNYFHFIGEEAVTRAPLACFLNHCCVLNMVPKEKSPCPNLWNLLNVTLFGKRIFVDLEVKTDPRMWGEPKSNERNPYER
jgi:hypothetical protein